MPGKTRDNSLERLRRYMADETRRLVKTNKGVVHRINLDDLEGEEAGLEEVAPKDPLERDVDMLFRGHRSRE